MSEDRNFRNCYYTKIDQKKSLDILLREKPPDLLLKVSQLTSRGLSSNRRKQVWQLLLDVVHADNRIAENRVKVQRNIVENILEALKIIDNVRVEDLSELDKSLEDDKLIVEYEKIMILVLLFESKQLQIHSDRQVKYFSSPFYFHFSTKIVFPTVKRRNHRRLPFNSECVHSRVYAKLTNLFCRHFLVIPQFRSQYRGLFHSVARNVRKICKLFERS